MTEAQKSKFVECRQCGEKMELLISKKHAGNWPIALILLGVFCTLFLGGAILGIPLLLLGIYLYTAKDTISYCSGCGYHFKIWKADRN